MASPSSPRTKLMPPPPRPSHTATSSSSTTSTTREQKSHPLLNDLKNVLQGHAANANYCLGGSIPISSTSSPTSHPFTTSPTKLSQITASLITIRFDASSPSHFPSSSSSSSSPHPISKIQFPHSSPSSPSPNSLELLFQACQPATFGYQGHDILDETFRKAGKLDREQFSTNFHPADYGILDAVAQSLLPGVDFAGNERVGAGGGEGSEKESGREELGKRKENWDVVAELYKLNVYSSPSGKFHSHVDTPRGSTQFGSLVVCLPQPHQGGALRVSHKNHSTLFDWSNDCNTNTIKWAAFYSDCEHEVQEVTSGHRITLTYNLYVSQRVGGGLRRSPIADPSSYSLFERVKGVLEQEDFMVDGGTLGFYCTHQYAHSRQSSDSLMPDALKGIDGTVFAVFRALGATVKLFPILSNEAWEDYDEYRREIWYEKQLDQGDTNINYEDWGKGRAKISRAGERFWELKMVDEMVEEGDDPTEFVNKYYPLHEYQDVVWLNSPKSEGWEVAIANLKYGNNASLMWHYSHAAIMVDVPPRSERSSA